MLLLSDDLERLVDAAEERGSVRQSELNEVLACYGWFDRRPFAGGEDSVWIARRA